MCYYCILPPELAHTHRCKVVLFAHRWQQDAVTVGSAAAGRVGNTGGDPQHTCYQLNPRMHLPVTDSGKQCTLHALPTP